LAGRDTARGVINFAKNNIMYLSIKYLVTINCCLLGFISCSRECPCELASAPFQVVSFSPAESDTVIVRRFTKGTNFQTLNDSALIDRANSNYTLRGADTLELGARDTTGHITSGFDYEIYIPAVNKLTKITKVTEEYEEGRCGRCSDFIKSYIKDGQAYTSHFLYITK